MWVMKVLEVIKRGTEYLENKGVESPRLQMELLLAHILNMPRLELYLNYDKEIDERKLAACRESVKRRADREPLQRLLGVTAFCGLEIKLTPDVLIPRPETEFLAELAWDFLTDLESKADSTLMALDWGTGSGCIALAIANHTNNTFVTGIDVSPGAIKTAAGNALELNLQDKTRFLVSDGFNDIPDSSKFDLIVANPPYIRSDEIENLPAEVRDHDPIQALDGGSDGLDFIRRLAGEAGDFLKPGGCLMSEIGHGQSEDVISLFTAHGWSVAPVKADLCGIPRYLTAGFTQGTPQPGSD
ncbi:MAG: peptide chain release factor N(5)-glutamine methyltransferase [Verrucomicrobia bacterium]|nr:peptide chain release factor N(5)-glutamine methyltransferase [Verrucomicrobiota bacterium]